MKVAISLKPLIKREFTHSLFFGICTPLLLTLLLSTISFSSPIKNYPKRLVQPDGDTISVFLTGDEYYNWVHDADNYTIVQDQATGYYVYANLINDELVPTNFVVGKADPTSTGLNSGVNISGEKMLERRNMFYEKSPKDMGMAPTSGTINNLVIYIRFSGEPEFTDSTITYDRMFNDSTAGANSMLNYYKEASYNALLISSTFYPTAPGSTVISYQDSHPRGYYKPYSSTNTIGYTGGTYGDQRILREHTLLMNASNFVASQIPSSLILDSDNDGNIDNVCFIVSGEPDTWSEILWPHMWALFSFTVNINGKRVYDYNINVQSFFFWIAYGVGIVSHEMGHTLGAPDLYRYYTSGMYPVLLWDLMSNQTNPPQHMGAYMKFRYFNWINNIPTISTGTHFLRPLTSSTNNCYRINSPNSTTEYFVLEYRRQIGTFESNLPGSGILIYRINTVMDGLGNANGPPDEVYIYRPNGTQTVNGDPNSAHYSQEVGRIAISDTTNPSSFLSNGNPGGLQISNIGQLGDSIVFVIGTHLITVTAPLAGALWQPGTQQAVNWSSSNVMGNLNIKLSTDGGSTFPITLASNIVNDGAENITVPSINESESCRLKVESSENTYVCGLNNGNFTILSSITVTSPPAGVIWIPGTQQTVGWTSFIGGNVNLKLSTDGGSTFPITLASNIVNDGIENITVPNNTANSCRLKVESSENIDIYGINNGNFTILLEYFTEQTSISLIGVRLGSTDWGDYDNDGDMDILLTGDNGTNRISKIYKNNGNNTFTEQTSISLIGVSYSSVAWGDYDNDGDLDILLAGWINGWTSKIYRNNGNNTFTEQTAISLTGVDDCSVAWGDYDNDGDLDILLTGQSSSLRVSKIFRNNGNNTFTEQTSISLTGVTYSSVAWGDYDNDGDLDILLTGETNAGIYTSKIYRNESNNTFTEQTSISLTGVSNSSVAWGDYDNDGDLDILLAGYYVLNQTVYYISKIYKNNGSNTFVEQTAILLTPVIHGSAVWGDYDNDGDLDILLTGFTYSFIRVTKIYRNNGDDTFTDMTLLGVLLPNVAWSKGIFGDYDNDGDLDILLIGDSGSGYISKILRNNHPTPNTVPTTPGNLNYQVNGTDVLLSWNKSLDNETPQNGLRYNLVIGTVPNGINVLSPMSDRNNGFRRVINLGNTNHNNFWTIKGLTGETYYWSVQAIDNTFEGSPFSTEQMISTITFQLMVNIADGWNMVSIPGLHPTNQNVNTWWAFRDMGANVFRYAGGYQVVTDGVPGTGYWMKHSGDRTYNTGEEWPAGGFQIVAHDPLNAASGWNLIGGYELSVTAANVTTNPPGLQSGPIYKYSNGYAVATTLDPGYGYWIKLTGAGQIIIPETMAKDGKPVEYFPESWGRIILTDATGMSYTLYAVKGEVDLSQYDLPPAPPAGMYDFRFKSGRIAEDINSSIQTIDMSGVTYPLTVRVEGMDIRMMDESGKMLNTNLKSGEDVVISDATIQKLMVSGELLPTVYSLEQNYPNPFNPSTKIRFSIPKESEVNLSVYNILGEKVRELKNEMMKPGYYEVEFNASALASGIYLYRIRAGDFLETKKMILIK